MMDMDDFKLAPVLRYRRSLEDALRRTFTEKQEQRIAEAEAYEALSARRKDHLREFAEKLEQGSDASENRLYMDYLVRMDDEMGVRKQAVCAAEEAAEIARGRLIEAVRHRKSLERLREKYRAAREKRIQRKEMRQLDELAASRFNRAQAKQGTGE